MTELDSRRLVILLGGRRVGNIVQGVDGRLGLTYDDDWRRSASAVPLSLSMPLAGRDYPDPIVRSYLWGLLPDSELVLERWARDYQVSARNPFALLRHVGEDCAGAAHLDDLHLELRRERPARPARLLSHAFHDERPPGGSQPHRSQMSVKPGQAHYIAREIYHLIQQLNPAG